MLRPSDRLLIPALLCLSLCSCNKFMGEKPVPKFAVTKTCGATGPCSVQFTDESVGAVSVQWSFGDGASSIERNPQHTYSAGMYYLVSLTAVGRDNEETLTDTLWLADKPVCQTRGSFACAKELKNGVDATDVISPGQWFNYYYFTPLVAGPVKIHLKPVPNGSSMRIQVLDAPSSTSESLGFTDGSAGDEITFYAGPLQTREYYLKVQQYNTTDSSQAYVISCTSMEQDIHEDNGTFSQASIIWPGQDYQGTILPKDEFDFIQFQQVRAAVMNIVLSPVPRFSYPYSKLWLEVYANASLSETPVAKTSGFPGEDIRISAGPMEAGTHYIRLYSTYDGESTDLYHLTIAYDTADNFEINNQYSSATLINPGQTVRANINAAGDVDLYSFTAINNHPAQVWVPAVPEGLPYMSVEIFSSASGSSTIYHKYLYPGNALSEMTSVNLNPGQKYYVRISSSAAGASVKQYQLKIDNQ